MSTVTLFKYQESNFTPLIEFTQGKMSRQKLKQKLSNLLKKSEQYIGNVLDHIEQNNLSLTEMMRRLFPTFFIGKNENYYEDLDMLWLDILHNLKDVNMPLKKRIANINDAVSTGLKCDGLPKECQAKQSATYKRTVLGIEKTLQASGFEALLLHWKKGAKTPIHGHPHFAYYNILSGTCRMTFYKKTSNGNLKETSTGLLRADDFIYSQAINKNTYENLIHSVECLEESFSLHLYSDNALKGKVF